MKIELEIIRLDNENVISTSCAFDTLSKSLGLVDLMGGSYKFVTGDSWDTDGGGGSVFYDKDAVYSGETTASKDYQYFKDGHYYHMSVKTSGDTRAYYIECNDPNHFLEYGRYS